MFRSGTPSMASLVLSVVDTSEDASELRRRLLVVVRPVLQVHQMTMAAITRPTASDANADILLVAARRSDVHLDSTR